MSAEPDRWTVTTEPVYTTPLDAVVAVAEAAEHLTESQIDRMLSIVEAEEPRR